MPGVKRPYPGGGGGPMMMGGYPPRPFAGGRPPYGYGMPPMGYYPPGMQPPFKKQKGGAGAPGAPGGDGNHGKNAVMQLNEVKPGVEYKFVSQTGPVHSPIFKMEVEINGTVRKDGSYRYLKEKTQGLRLIEGLTDGHRRM